MSALMRSFILSLCFLFANNAFALELTKSSVESFLTKIDKAIDAHDIDTIENSMSDAIKIVITLDIQGQKQTVKLSKDQYLGGLKQSWAIASDYERNNKVTNIEIQGDKALYQAITKEKTTSQGQTISGNTTSEGLIEIIDGKFQLTNLTAQTSVQ